MIDRVRTQAVLRALGQQPDELLAELASQYAVLVPLVDADGADWLPSAWDDAAIQQAFARFVEQDGALYDELVQAYAQAVRPLA